MAASSDPMRDLALAYKKEIDQHSEERQLRRAAEGERDALRARVAELEAQVYTGESFRHAFTWKARAAELAEEVGVHIGKRNEAVRAEAEAYTKFELEQRRAEKAEQRAASLQAEVEKLHCIKEDFRVANEALREEHVRLTEALAESERKRAGQTMELLTRKSGW